MLNQNETYREFFIDATYGAIACKGVLQLTNDGRLSLAGSVFSSIDDAKEAIDDYHESKSGLPVCRP